MSDLENPIGSPALGGGGPPDEPPSSGRPDPRGRRIPVSIEDEMRSSYLDYAMSVIIGRAIPDVRDGLKPVHRRILFGMHEMNLTAQSGYKKCARVVGDVLGKYHPHGDASVYDALVRMAQDFSMRYPLVDGQGNFGSVDGDPPAAMRYTECRLSRLAGELLSDIDQDTVGFGPNFDDSETEPLVLPARFPNLLVNGSGGIAVGMATNIPPHNLAEIIDATLLVLKAPDVGFDELLRAVPGPDFPTAGFIYGRRGIVDAYKTGRGSITMRARAVIEPMAKSDREHIVVTELPYQVNKARLLEKIAGLVREKRIEGISDLRDESDRDGMRIVIELKRDAAGQIVLNQLYQMTAMQQSFGVINLAIVGGQPRVLDLRQTLLHFVDHRRDVVTRRTRFELAQAESQREIVEGLGMAVTDVDVVVATIRRSPDPERARAALMELPLAGLEDFVRRAGRPDAEIEAARARGEYRLSERQAKAILEMRLARLTGLEREKLAAEYGQLCDTIARLKAILADPALLDSVIEQELRDVKERFPEGRRTEIVSEEGEIDAEDLIADEDMVVTVSHAGYIKRAPATEYRAQKRGGRGKSATALRDEDFVNQMFVASAHSFVLFLSDRGKAYLKKIWEIPQAARTAKGKAIVNFVGMEPGEKVAAIVPVRQFQEGLSLVTATKRGLVKRTDLMAYSSIRATGIIGVSIEEGDELIDAALVDATKHILLGTAKGQSIRFPVEGELREIGRDTRGVRGIELRDGDRVVSMDVAPPPGPDEASLRVLAVCANGYGKRTELAEYRVQGRGGLGIIAIDASERNGDLVKLMLVEETHDLMVITDGGTIIRTKVAEVREAGRNTQGVRVIRLDAEEKVVALERLAESDDEPPASEMPPGSPSEMPPAATETTGSEPPASAASEEPSDAPDDPEA
ncbi:MAG: DNA gyrase subunit A [Deltaproteobacteria bacterium]|nr:DNA gyrase subunit A [Deltaproteobacteria bacterium]